MAHLQLSFLVFSIVFPELFQFTRGYIKGLNSPGALEHPPSQKLLRFRPHLAQFGAAKAGDQRKVAGGQHRLTTALQIGHGQAIPGGKNGQICQVSFQRRHVGTFRQVRLYKRSCHEFMFLFFGCGLLSPSIQILR